MERIEVCIIELDENDEIIDREKDLNDILMSIDINGDIHEQAERLGYGDVIYTAEDIEREIAYNIKTFGDG